MKFHFKELAARLTGVSAPVFGVSWNPPEPERRIVRELLIFLEDRRVLYNPFYIEIESQVIDSVIQIRAELTATLKRLGENAQAASSVRAMRAACRQYLDNLSCKSKVRFGLAFLVELGELRAVFGMEVALLAIKYGIDIEGDLTTIIPPNLKQDSSGDSGSQGRNGG